MNEVQQEVAQSAGQDLLTWLDTLRLGTPNAYKGLSAVPVFTKGAAARPAYRLLAAAIAAGEVEVEETEIVQQLRVHNRSADPVLILAGEEMAGGWQNRIANTSLLVAAHSSFTLPVTCVEHGAWSSHRGQFRSDELAYSSLRRMAQVQSSAGYATSAAPRTDQHAIWASVATLHERTRTKSATGAMRDAYTKLGDDLSAAVNALPIPDGDPIGVVAMLGGKSHCADLFDSPDTLRSIWPRLIRSYALDAVGTEPAEPQLGSATRLLAYPCGADRSVYASPGLGLDVRMSSHQITGAALIWEHSVIHTSLFRRRPSAPARSAVR